MWSIFTDRYVVDCDCIAGTGINVGPNRGRKAASVAVACWTGNWTRLLKLNFSCWCLHLLPVRLLLGMLPFGNWCLLPWMLLVVILVAPHSDAAHSDGIDIWQHLAAAGEQWTTDENQGESQSDAFKFPLMWAIGSDSVRGVQSPSYIGGGINVLGLLPAPCPNTVLTNSWLWEIPSPLSIQQQPRPLEGDNQSQTVNVLFLSEAMYQEIPSQQFN